MTFDSEPPQRLFRMSHRPSSAVPRHSRGSRLRAAIGGLAVLVLLPAGCGGGGGSQAAEPAPPAGASPPPAVHVSAVPAADPGSPLAAGWERGPFMQIFVRSYQDSDGDGIGDLRGLVTRLDHVRDLGIRGLWLMPITRSQDHDHGCAVTDYRDVEPAYGGLADVDELLRQAHAHGIGVILDYVINHSAAGASNGSGSARFNLPALSVQVYQVDS